MTETLEGQVGLFDLDTWSGRTSPEHSAAENQKARISPPSSKKSSKSQNRAPLSMCVYRTEDGQNPGVTTLKMAPGALLGEFTTHSFGESPREENASRLSQILEACPHPKYSLSARACEGILRRAERRGKELPPELKTALEQQSVSKNEPGSQGGAKESSVDCRNGTINKWINGTLQSKEQGYNTNSNNVVLTVLAAKETEK